MSIRRCSRHFALRLVLFLGLTAPLSAQSSFALVPFLGYYRPIGGFGPTKETATWLPSKPRELSALAWGVEARAWGDGRLGMSLQAGVATSTISSQTSGGSPVRLAAQVLAVSLQAQYDLSPSVGNHDVWIGVGPALIRHGGDDYSVFGPAIDYGGAVGAGLDIAVSRRLRATLGAGLLLYQIHVRNAHTGNIVERGFQTDALLRAGLSWHWSSYSGH